MTVGLPVVGSEEIRHVTLERDSALELKDLAKLLAEENGSAASEDEDEDEDGDEEFADLDAAIKPAFRHVGGSGWRGPERKGKDPERKDSMR